MRALVLSGGANKGAYQAGMLYHLLHDLELHYDIICGVSVGALNGAFLATYYKGQERKAADGLRQLWLGLRRRYVYKKWPLGIVQAAWKASLYNSKPLRTLIRCHIDPELIRHSGKHLRVGATCLDTGEYHVFHQGYPHLLTAVMASCAFPGAFEPVELEGKRWIDGGVRDITPVQAAIDAGATRIDALVTSPSQSIQVHDAHPRSYEVAFRAMEVMSDEVLANDLRIASRINQLVALGKDDKHKRVRLNVLRPDNGLVESLFDFSRDTCRGLWNSGYADAMHYVRENPAFLAA